MGVLEYYWTENIRGGKPFLPVNTPLCERQMICLYLLWLPSSSGSPWLLEEKEWKSLSVSGEKTLGVESY